MASLILSLKCPHCLAEPGDVCTTPSGKVRSIAHRNRIDAANSGWRHREMIFRLKNDDPRFGLKADDELVCVNYPYDAKVTVLYRLSDGFDPNCNQYTRDVEFLRWAGPADRLAPEQTRIA